MFLPVAFGIILGVQRSRMCACSVVALLRARLRNIATVQPATVRDSVFVRLCVAFLFGSMANGVFAIEEDVAVHLVSAARFHRRMRYFDRAASPCTVQIANLLWRCGRCCVVL